MEMNCSRDTTLVVATGYMVLLLCYHVLFKNGQKLGQKVLDLGDDPLGKVLNLCI